MVQKRTKFETQAAVHWAKKLIERKGLKKVYSGSNGLIGMKEVFFFAQRFSETISFELNENRRGLLDSNGQNENY